MASATFKFGDNGLIRWDGVRQFEVFESGLYTETWTSIDLPRSKDDAREIARRWWENSEPVAVVTASRIGSGTDLESVVRDLRGEHPWIPGAVFGRHPGLAEHLAQAIEDLIARGQ